MITNRRQYRISKAQLGRFEDALERMEAERSDRTDVHPLIVQAEIDAMRSQAEELHRDITEYEELARGETQVLELQSFDQLPDALVKARIASGLSQRQLAEKLGIKEQQIQIQELQTKIQELELQVENLEKKASNHDDLVERLSEVLE